MKVFTMKAAAAIVAVALAVGFASCGGDGSEPFFGTVGGTAIDASIVQYDDITVVRIAGNIAGSASSGGSGFTVTTLPQTSNYSSGIYGTYYKSYKATDYVFSWGTLFHSTTDAKANIKFKFVGQDANGNPVETEKVFEVDNPLYNKTALTFGLPGGVINKLYGAQSYDSAAEAPADHYGPGTGGNVVYKVTLTGKTGYDVDPRPTASDTTDGGVQTTFTYYANSLSSSTSVPYNYTISTSSYRSTKTVQSVQNAVNNPGISKVVVQYFVSPWTASQINGTSSINRVGSSYETGTGKYFYDTDQTVTTTTGAVVGETTTWKVWRDDIYTETTVAGTVHGTAFTYTPSALSEVFTFKDEAAGGVSYYNLTE